MPSNDDEEIKRIRSIVLAALISGGIVGGSGSTAIQLLFPQARSDPFTGADGRELSKRIEDLAKHDAELRRVLDELSRELMAYHNELQASERSTIEFRTRDDSRVAYIIERVAELQVRIKDLERRR